MKNLVILFSPILILILIGCNNELDYCQMLADDQSYVSKSTDSKEQRSANREKRHQLIKANFKQLIAHAESEGFPKIGSLNTSGLDSCRNWAVTMTLFHIGQIDPQLFFEDHTIDILSKEIKSGNLSNKSLVPPLREGFDNHRFCLNNKNSIREAVESWDLKLDDLPEMQFVECDNN